MLFTQRIEIQIQSNKEVTNAARQYTYDRNGPIFCNTLKNSWCSIQSSHTTGRRRNVQTSKEQKTN